jgi:hypothetical protein
MGAGGGAVNWVRFAAIAVNEALFASSDGGNSGVAGIYSSAADGWAVDRGAQDALQRSDSYPLPRNL